MTEINYKDEIDFNELNPTAIKDLQEANRYARAVSSAREEIKKIEEAAAVEIKAWEDRIAQVNEWKEEVLKPLQDKLDHCSTLLMDFHMREFEANGVKSIKLPYGVNLKSVQGATKIEVSDDALLLAYAKKVKLVNIPDPTPKWAEIKKTLAVTAGGQVVNTDGEILDFVKAIPQERKFEVK